MEQPFKPWLYNLIVCLVYIILSVLTMQGFETLAVWPSAGVALAGILLFGRNAWPGIAVGTFITVYYYFQLNQSDPLAFDNLAINFSTMFGNTGAALIAYQIVKDNINNRDPFEQVSRLTNKFFFACIAIGLFSALPGVGIYYLLGKEWHDGFALGVVNWTISNSLAAIVITPALYFIWRRWPHRVSVSNVYHVAVLTLLVCFICYLVFGPGHSQVSSSVIQPAILLFPLLYCAIKLSPTITTNMNMLAFFLAWIGTNQQQGYFYSFHPEFAETSMQFFFGFILSAVLVVQAVFAQRKLEQTQLTGILERKVCERTKALEDAKEEALTLAVTDALTGILNRRGFFQTVNQQFGQYLRHPNRCSVLLMDIDRFKNINDEHGHAIGDEAIQATAEIISKNCRTYDVVGRIGGEEFVLFLPMTDIEDANRLAERIRCDIEFYRLIKDKTEIHFTISIGVAEIESRDSKFESMLQRADKALYQSKNAGRNRVSMADS